MFINKHTLSISERIQNEDPISFYGIGKNPFRLSKISKLSFVISEIFQNTIGIIYKSHSKEKNFIFTNVHIMNSTIYTIHNIAISSRGNKLSQTISERVS